MPRSYLEKFAFKSQFQGAEMIAEEYGITREDTDRFGLRSQDLARRAWNEGRFDREVVPVDAPVLDDEGKPTGETRTITSDEGLRETSLQKLSTLKAVMEGGVHTAGTSSQITDGAAAVLFASEDAVKRLGLRPRARVVYSTIVGVDPVTMLKGPIPATRKVLERTHRENLWFLNIHARYRPHPVPALGSRSPRVRTFQPRRPARLRTVAWPHTTQDPVRSFRSLIPPNPVLVGGF